MTRICAVCCRELDVHSFSPREWDRGEGMSRCYACVETAPEVPRPVNAARENKANRATFTQEALYHPFAQGAFRWVAKGEYTHGDRAGELAVCKWFKKEVVFDATFYKKDIKAVDKAIQFIYDWNETGFTKRPIRMNRAEVWTFDETCEWAGRKVLHEPYIRRFQKFNSNSGWASNSTPWHRVMQALSHFSYHISGGKYLLCDLQGGVYRSGPVLTDPVILSQTCSYGVTDLGPEGISNFFHHHECNEFCKDHWLYPSVTASMYEVVQGTTMIPSSSKQSTYCSQASSSSSVCSARSRTTGTMTSTTRSSRCSAR